MSPRVVIVTPDFVGPVRNGGVGTACFWLARTLSDAGNSVLVLFSSNIETGTPNQWSDHFQKEHGFSFVHLDGWVEKELPREKRRRLYPTSDNLKASYLTLQFLKRYQCDIVYFQDFLGHGLRTLQYKRAGLGLENTRCVLTLHSSHRWIRQGMELIPEDLSELELDFQERECAHLADALVAPSRHMAQWAEKNWNIDLTKIEIIPYCFESSSALRETRSSNTKDISHLVFFGRLETRKGLHLFLHAISTNLKLKKQIRHITFLGKQASVNGVPSLRAIKNALIDCDYTYEIIDGKDANEAWDWLEAQRNILVVTPSILDNLPLTVIELFCRKIPFVTTTAGGIPEIVGDGNKAILSNPTGECLSETLGNVISNENAIDYTIGYSASQANELNIKHLVSQLAIRNAALPTQSLKQYLSVIITNFNSSEYLKLALESLERQTQDQEYEIVIVDDSSSNPKEQALFQELKHQKQSNKIRFCETPQNRGPGGARNFGASQAKGQYLVFFDSDNEAEEHMLELMCTAIEHSGYDCLTCFTRVVPQHDRESPSGIDTSNESFIYSPLGACINTAFHRNILGDTCSIWKAEAFNAIGRYREDRHSYEDWEILLRLLSTGYKLGVIPEPICRYREQKNSYNDQANSLFSNRRLVLQTYSELSSLSSFDLASICGILSSHIELGASKSATLYDYFTNIQDSHLQDLLAIHGEGHRLAPEGDLQRLRQRLSHHAREWSKSNPRIMIYGVGLHTRVLLSTYPEVVKWLVGFIDRSHASNEFLGKPCIKPEAFDKSIADTVIYSSKAFELQMLENLKQHDVRHILLYNNHEL